jgi:hypothetical protein
MVVWHVVGVGVVAAILGGLVVVWYGVLHPDALQPTGSPGYLLRVADLEDSTLARRLLVGTLGGLLVAIGAVVAWLGWLLESGG